MKIEGIAKRVAQELNISFELAEQICRSQFKFILENIKNGKEAINCIHLGKFSKNARYNKNNENRRREERKKEDLL